MDRHAAASEAPGPGRWWGPVPTSSASTDVMNQLCRVCGEPAAGFHFGAFTCEGCKSFFGRTYNNLSSISECKNNGECVINKKNRTSCKACRLRKCLLVGMSKSGSRYGRRSNWFKIHCLLQEQQQNQQNSVMPNKNKMWEGVPFPPGKPVPSLLDVDNNNSTPLSKDTKDGSISPLLLPTGYGSEAAAALWAARGSLLPVHPHHPGLPFFAPPFLHSPPFHHPPPTNFLLPFIPPRHPPPEHTILSASSSSSSATCSPVPTEDKSSSVSSPSVANKTTAATTSSSSLTTTTPTTTTDNFNYNKSLAVLRSLGPVQETPIDLSFRNCKKNSSDVGNSTDSGSHNDGQTDKQSNKHVTEQSGDVRGRDCSLRKNNTTPLDLTCSKT